jgi:hypothetical protein
MGFDVDHKMYSLKINSNCMNVAVKIPKFLKNYNQIEDDNRTKAAH